MRLKHPLMLAVAIAVLGWVVVPPGDLDLDSACQPDSLPAQISHAVTGKWFWQRQLAAATAERDHWLTIQSRVMFDESNPSANETRLSRMTEPDDDAARRFRQNRIVWLSTCTAEIERRLN